MKITQICGSMEGKDVVTTVDALKKKKEKQAQAKEAKFEKKREKKRRCSSNAKKNMLVATQSVMQLG